MSFNSNLTLYLSSTLFNKYHLPLILNCVIANIHALKINQSGCSEPMGEDWRARFGSTRNSLQCGWSDFYFGLPRNFFLKKSNKWLRMRIHFEFFDFWFLILSYLKITIQLLNSPPLPWNLKKSCLGLVGFDALS